MPFPERIRRIESEKATNCGVCDDPFLPNDEIELHSITSLHLVHKNGRYIVTDPPTGHEAIRGKTLALHAYSPKEIKECDGIPLHKKCHQEIHRITLIQAKLDDSNFSGNTPTPKLLEEITLFYMNRKRPIVYENIDRKNYREIKIEFIERVKITFV